MDDNTLRRPMKAESASNEDPEAVGREEYFRLPISPISSPSGEVLFVDGNRVLIYKPGTREFRVYCGLIESGCRVGDRLKEARFEQIGGLCLSPTGELFIADTGNHRIVIVRSDGVVEHYIGSSVSGGGTSESNDDIETSPLLYPRGMCLALSGDLLVADTGNHVIRRIDKTTKQMTTVAGQFGVSGSFEGWRSCALLNYPTTVRMGCEGELIVTMKQLSSGIGYSSHLGYKSSIWKIWPDGRVTQESNNIHNNGVYDAIPDFSTGNLLLLQITTEDQTDEIPEKSCRDHVYLSIPYSSEDESFGSLQTRLLKEDRAEKNEVLGKGSKRTLKSHSLAAKTTQAPQYLLPLSLFDQASVYILLDALSGVLAAEDPKISQLKTQKAPSNASSLSSATNSATNASATTYTGVIHFKIEGEDEYNPIAREFFKFGATTNLRALYRIAENLPQTKFVLDHPENVVLLGPDGVILQHSARPLQKIVSFFEAENLVYLNAVPPGSKEQHLNTNDAGCASNGPKVIVLEDDNIAYSQVADLRGPYVRRIPLIFRIAPRKMFATLECTRSDTYIDVNFEEENGFTLHKLVKKAREKFGSSSNAIKLIKRFDTNFDPSATKGPNAKASIIEFCETNPIRLAVIASGSNQTPIYITVTPSTIVDHIVERFIYEKKIKAPFHKVFDAQKRRLFSFWSVSDCGLKHGDTIYVDPRETSTVLYVMTLSRTTVPVPFDPNDSVALVKTEFYHRGGIPPCHHRLTYGSRWLQDDDKISDFGIQTGSVVHSVLHSRGG